MTTTTPRHRYDQCDATCTVDCGHCKGAGRPTPALTTGPRAVTWTPALDGESVRVVRNDLPAVADEREYAVELTETDLVRMLAALRATQLGLDDVTGGL